MEAEKIALEILNELDSKTGDIPLDDYIEVLERLLSDIGDRLNSAEIEKQEQDEQEED